MKTIQSILNSRRLNLAMNFIKKVILTYFVFLGILAFAYMFLFVTGSNDLINSIEVSKSTTAELAKLDINSQRNLIRVMAKSFKMILTWSAFLSLIFNIAIIAGGYLRYLYEKYLDKKFLRKTK